MGKTIRISDEDYEKAAGILDNTKETMAELFSRSIRLLDDDVNEEDQGRMDDRQMKGELQKIKQLLYRIVRAACPLAEEDAYDPDFGIGLADVYEDKNKHPEKYR